MGILTYNSVKTVEIEDRPLAHLRSVVFAKLRRGEAFAFSWDTSVDRGSGRNSIWLSPEIPVTFEFFTARDIPLNPDWVRALNKAANSAGGLVMLPEPGTESEPEPAAEPTP